MDVAEDMPIVAQIRGRNNELEIKWAIRLLGRYVVMNVRMANPETAKPIWAYIRLVLGLLIIITYILEEFDR